MRRLARLAGVADRTGLPLVAAGDVLYHVPERRPLQDVLTCIREKTTIDAVGKKLEANAERYLKPAHEMARLFRDLPEAVAETMRFASRISFSLDQLKYQYPDEPVPPGKTAQQHLVPDDEDSQRRHLLGSEAGRGGEVGRAYEAPQHTGRRLGLPGAVRREPDRARDAQGARYLLFRTEFSNALRH
jgi:DNA polymerase III alpha subunit